MLGFTLVASVLTGILFGALPALTARPELAEVMKEESSRAGGGGGPRRARGLLVVSQVAFSFMLLIAAGLMLRSFWKLQQVDAGFRPENVLTARVSLNWSKYDADDKVRRFGEELLRKLEARPAGALGRAQLLGAARAVAALQPAVPDRGPAGRARRAPLARLPRREPALLRDDRPARWCAAARSRTRTSRARQPVAVVNQAFARHYWGDGDPIGQRVSFGDEEQPWVTIVGVVGDVRQYGLDREPGLELYRPFAQNPGWGAVLVRTRVEPTAIASLLGRAVHELDPEQPVDRIRTLAEVRRDSVASPRLTAMLLGIFALVALVITAAGIGGVLALSVSQRTVEIGVRMAMGAERGAVMRMILGQGLGLVLAGLALGIAGSDGAVAPDRAAALRRARDRSADLRGRGGPAAGRGGGRLPAARRDARPRWIRSSALRHA